MKDFIEGYTMFIDMYYYRRGIMNRYKRFKRHQRVGKEIEKKKYGMPISKNPPPPPRRSKDVRIVYPSDSIRPTIIDDRVRNKLKTLAYWNKDVTVLERDNFGNIVHDMGGEQHL